MKQIEKPSNWLIGILLIPAILVFFYIILIGSSPIWAIATICISVSLYLATLTFFCIRQRCYRQLIVNYIVIVLWVLIYLIQFKFI